MDDRQLFWISRQSWPKDHCGQNVFLGAAVHEIGAAMVPGWTGGEPTTTESLYGLSIGDKPLPQLTAKPYQREDVRKLLASRTPPIDVARIEGLRWERPTLVFPEGAWEIGCDMARAIDADRLAAKSRLSAVQHKIRDGLATGALKCVLRHPVGGEFSEPVSPAAWNTERIHNRFRFCQMDPRDPFGSGVAGDGFRLIFITRDSLDAFKGGPVPDEGKQATMGGPRSEAFKAKVKAIMEASPNRRTHSKKQFYAMAPDLTHNEVDRVRLRVIQDLGLEKIWAAPGRGPKE
ncbi:MAG: hypothetical protein EOS07_05410 [Mesorhizobium sp.]|uniref:hypothetical protein n=1 Tax=Mesorhizobium sp. TaxID=1871066 RepID=UPI000FE674CE|nr:hypothetical protein [Mesorhizobium sp.]RWO12046.1 MAG: hypothetical protein EOS07_05410 [Mesorhizobium sp.]TIP28505.1 MAG: hypothetical protein E5X67_10630 [Mesorhizobium sp.]